MKPIRKPCYYKISDISLRRAKDLYNFQKGGAKSRGIPFLMSFIEWLIVWEMSGKLDDRGCFKGQYVMARHGDKGPYAWWNVSIVLCSENTYQGNVGKVLEQSSKDKIAAKIKNRTKLSVVQLDYIRVNYCPGLQGVKSENSASAIARKLGVSSSTVTNAYKRMLATCQAN